MYANPLFYTVDGFHEKWRKLIKPKGIKFMFIQIILINLMLGIRVQWIMWTKLHVLQYNREWVWL